MGCTKGEGEQSSWGTTCAFPLLPAEARQIEEEQAGLASTWTDGVFLTEPSALRATTKGEAPWSKQLCNNAIVPQLLGHGWFQTHISPPEVPNNANQQIETPAEIQTTYIRHTIHLKTSSEGVKPTKCHNMKEILDGITRSLTSSGEIERSK